MCDLGWPWLDPGYHLIEVLADDGGVLAAARVEKI